jgi:hypothetical protein
MSPSYTASIYADLLGIPFVAFNRPNYLDSSGWVIDRSSALPERPAFKIGDGTAHSEEEGRWYFEYIFPALWQKFAIPNGCSSIVTTSHSYSVMSTIIAASLYSKATPMRAVPYVWTGMVLSGFGIMPNEHFVSVSQNLATIEYAPGQLPPGQDFRIHSRPYLEEDKKALMLGVNGVSDPQLGPLVWAQTTGLLKGEVTDLFSLWPSDKMKGYMAGVEIPVLCGMGDQNWIWRGTREDVDALCARFTSSPRVEGAVVKNAPHAIELSKVGRGWWIRVFGWAVEVAAGEEVKLARMSSRS